jgi:hypothetical protein
MGSVTIETLTKRVQGLKDRFERLEKDVKGLKDLLNVHDNWHAKIRTWKGHEVTICDRSGISSGTLLWSDRYNVCVLVGDARYGPRERMYTKGGINWIEEA